MNINPFLEASLAIQIHMIGAVGAFVLGAIVLWRKKGGWLHRINGRIWVALMMVTAISGFFIHEIRMWGNFGPIHIFSIVVPVSLVWSIYCIRRGNVREHQLAMKGTYFGLVAAGAFTLIPGRLSFEILFGNELAVPSLPYDWTIPLVVAALIAFLVSRRAGAR